MAHGGHNGRVRQTELNLHSDSSSPPHMSSNTRFDSPRVTGFSNRIDTDSYLRYSLTHVPYTPDLQSNEPAIQINDDPYVPVSPSHARYCPYSPSYVRPVSSSRYSPSSSVSEETSEHVQDDDPYIPYSPSNAPNHTHYFPTRMRDEYSPIEPSVQVGRYPGVNFPRWRRLFRRLRPAILNGSNLDSGFQRRDSSSSVFIPRAANGPRMETAENVIPTGQDGVVHDVRDRSVEIPSTHKGNAVEVVANYLHEEMKEQSSGMKNFECNVCLDMAKDPVVTSCGHLFCWSCLYRWLHLHSNTKECPVCKGEVKESNIIPIYGRGSSTNQVERNHDEEEEDLSLKVPPRPHGHRIESLRQRIHRPFSRRLVEGIRSWRRNVDNEIQNGNRVEGQEEQNGHGGFDSASRRNPARLRLARWLQRDDSEQGLDIFDNSRVDGLDERSRSSSLVRDGANVWRQLALNRFCRNERLEAIRASISSMEGILARFERITNHRIHSGPSASVSHQDPELLPGQDGRGLMSGTDQASVSSTAAVIEGDIGGLNASVGPNDLGFSPAVRRRRNVGTSSLFDVDGGVHRCPKRRRSNL